MTWYSWKRPMTARAQRRVSVLELVGRETERAVGRGAYLLIRPVEE